MKKNKILYEDNFNFNDLKSNSLKMLYDVSSLLKKYNVNFWLDFGTLLGLVREKDIIPWDGDFDLSTLDQDILSKNELFDELELLGYDVNIDFSNIKITKKNWNVGFYKLDLHRLRINDNNEAEYLYGEKKSAFATRFEYYRDQILHASIMPKTKNKIKFSEYAFLFNFLMEKKYSPDRIFEIENIIYQKTYPNHPKDFNLIVKNKKLISDYSNSKSKNVKFFRFIFSQLNNKINRALFYLLNKINFKSKTPILVVRHDLKYFENFENLEFNGFSYNIPSYTKEYLKKIYGKNWHVPVNKWEISDDSPISNN